MDSFSEKLYSGTPVFQQSGPEVSRFRQFLNFLGCLIVLPIYSIITGYTRHPLTIDILLTIFAAEYNRYSNDRRRRQLKSPPRPTYDLEKAGHLLGNEPSSTECMAAIVGYREDPDLFARALESYKNVKECRFVLVGVDGNDVPDMEMVQVFQKVATSCSYAWISLQATDIRIGIPRTLSCYPSREAVR